MTTGSPIFPQKIQYLCGQIDFSRKFIGSSQFHNPISAFRRGKAEYIWIMEPVDKIQ